MQFKEKEMTPGKKKKKSIEMLHRWPGKWRIGHEETDMFSQAEEKLRRYKRTPGMEKQLLNLRANTKKKKQ